MNNKFTFLIPFLILMSCLYSCSKKFDSQRWKEKSVDWQISDVRENMIDDLINSNILYQKDANQVIDLLGEPEQIRGDFHYHLIREKNFINIDPEYISYLIIEFDGNKKVKKYYQEKTK